MSREYKPPFPDSLICFNCGHYRSLHFGEGGECEACDSPEVPMNERCPGFTPDPSSELEELD